MPVALGLLTNSNTGFVPFSKVVHDQFAPLPPVSKLMGLFCENPILAISMDMLSVTIFFILNVWIVNDLTYAIYLKIVKVKNTISILFIYEV
jgi:hypothetical protein